MLSIYRLPNQLPDEKVIKVLRRDFFILFQKVALFLLLIILPLGFYAILVYWQPGLLANELFFPIMVLCTSAYYLFAWLFLFFMFIDYYLDVWIITTERIIDIEQQGFFARTVSEQRLNRVQDVTSEVKGISPTVFRYGDVFVQTAGEKQRFNFMQVPNPESVRDFIIKQSEMCKAKHPPQEN